MYVESKRREPKDQAVAQPVSHSLSTPGPVLLIQVITLSQLFQDKPQHDQNKAESPSEQKAQETVQCLKNAPNIWVIPYLNKNMLQWD